MILFFVCDQTPHFLCPYSVVSDSETAFPPRTVDHMTVGTLAHSHRLKAEGPAKAVRGHTERRVWIFFFCLSVTHELPCWLVAVTDSRPAYPDAKSRIGVLQKSSTLLFRCLSCSHFLLFPSHSSPTFLFHSYTLQTFPAYAPMHCCSTPLGQYRLSPLSAPTPWDWWTPCGLPGEPPSIMSRTGPAQNCCYRAYCLKTC